MISDVHKLSPAVWSTCSARTVKRDASAAIAPPSMRHARQPRAPPSCPRPGTSVAGRPDRCVAILIRGDSFVGAVICSGAARTVTWHHAPVTGQEQRRRRVCECDSAEAEKRLRRASADLAVWGVGGCGPCALKAAEMLSCSRAASPCARHRHPRSDFLHRRLLQSP